MNNREIREQLITARDEYIELIKHELMGPGSELSMPDTKHELISSSPLSRYSVGILFPQGNKVEQDNDETVIINEDLSEDHSEADTFENQESTEKKHERIVEYDETASENLDEEIGMATQYKPSSMGITFLIKGKPDQVHCAISFGTYRSARLPDCIVPYEPEHPEDYSVPSELAQIMTYDNNLKAFRLLRKTDIKEIRGILECDTIPENEYPILKNSIYRLNDFLTSGYVREPHSIDDIIISFGESDYADNEDTAALDGTSAKLVALRTKISQGVWSLTVMLVNGNEDSPPKAKDCIFQSRIEISSENNEFLFVESNPNPDPEYMDEEEKSLELLYRHKKIYATGLGTSADWEIDTCGSGRVWTEFFPNKEIPAMNFSLPVNEFIKDTELSMKYLSDLDPTDREEKLNSMSKLVDLYSAWILDLEKTAEPLDERYKTAAAKNIKECKRASERMKAGIQTLRENDNAFSAFLLANRAMFMQRVHIQKQNDMARENSDRYPDDIEISEWLCSLDYSEEDDTNCKWRPFQIAFLLMDINSIVQDDGEDRSIVDLIWFPTGGGKTEAYLGLTAFTIFYRKLSYAEHSDGTSVMMRYTLRLLAAQQFTRAATLICACEYIRQDCLKKKHKYPTYPLGRTPITIGLWIGGTHIPNKNMGDKSADYHLEKLLKVSSAHSVRSEKERHNKFQVLKCPWCGTKLVKDERNGRLVGHWGYAMSGNHFYMFCPHEDCDFTKRLPIQIIDEELYAWLWKNNVIGRIGHSCAFRRSREKRRIK